MNVSLTPELNGFVQQKVQSGMYHSASEVVRAGLRLLKEHESSYQFELDRVRQEIEIGAAQIERGEYTEYEAGSLWKLAEELKAEGRRRLAQERGTKS
jgi:antitoxin ParD1/3/4